MLFRVCAQSTADHRVSNW